MPLLSITINSGNDVRGNKGEVYSIEKKIVLEAQGWRNKIAREYLIIIYPTVEDNPALCLLISNLVILVVVSFLPWIAGRVSDNTRQGQGLPGLLKISSHGEIISFPTKPGMKKFQKLL